MTKKTSAWMPLWIGDYLADTQHLSRDEHGAYLLMLMTYWRNGGPLPDDDRRLASIVKASPKEWKALRPILLEFFTVADGAWVQKRVEAELVASKDRAEKAASKAQKGAAARWNQAKDDAPSNAPSNAPSILQALPKQCPSPSPSSSSLEEANASVASKLPTCPVEAIISSYHEALPELPAVRMLGDPRRKAITAFWRWVLTSKRTDGAPRAQTAEHALAWIRAYFERAHDNDFLMGRTERFGAHSGWRCDFDFLLTEKGKRHVIEKTEAYA